jgi:predicted Zn finger-like uncharacterized protein
MSLATRCTSCATAFRVVQDQLKVSEGWVRCGRCDAVFNALEGLFDLGRDAPADWEDPIVSLLAPRPAEPLVLAPADPEEEEDDEAAGDDDAPASNLGELLADPIDAHLFGPRKKAEAAPKPAGQIGARDRVEFSDARFDSDLFSENASVPDTELIVAPVTDPAALPLESSVRPDFVRRADRRARWHTRSARAALGAVALVALVALALQVGHHYRDSLAAQSPPLRAPLVAWCRIAGCKLEAPRRIDDVQVESTALTRAPALDGFILSITLRNRGALTLVLPSIDLTLTDGNGRLVARRALAPRDFRAPEIIAPGAETSLQTVLTAGAASVVGYTVEIFYP